MSGAARQFYRFADFVVDADQKVLLRNGKPTPLKPKVFDTLLVLVENSGRIVTKEELMNRLWPDSFVEESNLTFNIQQLRKCLGDNARAPQFVETISRRGYRFIVELEEPASTDGGNEPAELTVPSTRRVIGPVSKVHRGRLTLFLALGLVVIAGAVLLWKVSRASNKNLGDYVATLPLKIERLTSSGQSNNAAISPDGRYLAYTRTVEGKQAVWLRQLATNANAEIVAAKDRIYGLSFANSGEYLYFVRGKPAALYRVSLLGDVPVKILDQVEGRFSLSPDDHTIAFIRELEEVSGHQQYSLMTANSDGTSERRLLTRNYPDKLDAPSWSSDGDSIFLAHGNSASGTQTMSLMEVHTADSTTRELSAERFANIAKIAALPHNQGLIMSAVKTVEGYRQLWFVSFPEMEFKEITAGLSSYSDLSLASSANKLVASQATRAFDIWIGNSHEPQNLTRITAATDRFSWTPDHALIYALTATGSVDLWMMRADGQQQKQLTTNKATNDAPVVTADGRYIVFVSNYGGAFQIWRMNIDGSNPVQITTGGGKNFPVTSPDGKWIFYNTTDDWQLWKVSIEGGESSRLTDYYGLFPAVSPDGKMIACLGKKGLQASLLVLPIDGGQPLRTFDLEGQNFSGTRLEWTPDGKALIYAREQNGITTLVKQPLSGGRVAEVTKFEDELFDFGYSSDGQLLAVTRGGWQSDIILFTDVSLR